MDKRKREYLEQARQQAISFQSLSRNSEWPLFREWAEKARADYDAKAHDPNIRHDHVALARALQGYDALNDLLTNFDKAINGLPKLNEQLDAAE